ncbi:MAG: BrnT family toxin [Candidatus Accumulibacter sp.]|uniref:BrnT family toxin n=1 Tax=Candidatus Accumulibacter proximus TaxID=2954385 RepID=A0A935Q0E6_9PROT|nr:BrnT family toxin [Candidatus Accumulibacter proximus]
MSTYLRWDDAKRQANLDKHGLDFADAPMVLESPYRLDVESVRGGEPRMQSFAYVFDVLAVLTVVHTTRDNALRIVSFRPASEEERSAYHEWLEEDFNGD